jgi:hypothetical protein
MQRGSRPRMDSLRAVLMAASTDDFTMMSPRLRQTQSYRRTRRTRLLHRRSARFCGIVYYQSLYTLLSAMVTVSLVFCFLPIRLLDDDLAASLQTSQGRLLSVAETVVSQSSPRRQQRGGVIRSLMLLSTGRRNVGGTPQRNDTLRSSIHGPTTDGENDENDDGVDSRIRRRDNIDTSAVGVSTDGSAPEASQFTDGKGDSNDNSVFGRAPLPESDRVHKDHGVRLRIRKRTATLS